MPARTWVPSGVSVALLLCVTACQGVSAPSTPAASPAASSPSPSPSAAAAAVPSPSPGLAVPSPSASPAPQASTPPAVITRSSFQFDQIPFAVMIDNISAARPQFGLAGADVVYEAPAEGGIPRLMPIYLRAGTDVDRIGPVRSARHYFIDIANEYRTPIVHIGASPQGFDALKTTGLPDLDEQRGDPGFVRDPDREAPHNAFVSTTSVRDALRERGVSVQPDLGPLSFGEYRPGTESANVVKIPYPGGERYKLEYDYDSGQQLYDRIMDGQPHLDGETGQQYAPGPGQKQMSTACGGRARRWA